MDNVNDAVMFERTRAAMTSLGITAEGKKEKGSTLVYLTEGTCSEQKLIFDVLAAVLHIGNIKFAADASGEEAVRTLFDLSSILTRYNRFLWMIPLYRLPVNYFKSIPLSFKTLSLRR